MSARTAIRLGVGLALSAFFLWLVFRNVDFAAMLAQVRAADHRYTVLYALSLVFIQLCRVYRWDVLIRPFARVSRAALFRISGVGLMMILVLPLRLGELARPYLLKKETGARMSSGLGSIVVERAIDGLLVTLFFFATISSLGGRYSIPRPLQIGGLVALAIFAGATLVIVLALVAGERVPRLIERFGAGVAPRLTARLTGMLRAFIDGLRSLPDVKAIMAFVAWTLAYWVVNGLGMYWMMVAFGWSLPPAAGFLLVSVIVIGIMIPAGPGFLGTYQGALLAGLSIFGINSTEAAAYGMVVYPISVAVTCAFGVPYLFTRRGKHLAGEIVMASEGAELGVKGPS